MGVLSFRVGVYAIIAKIRLTARIVPKRKNCSLAGLKKYTVRKIPRVVPIHIPVVPVKIIVRIKSSEETVPKIVVEAAFFKFLSRKLKDSARGRMIVRKAAAADALPAREKF